MAAPGALPVHVVLEWIQAANNYLCPLECPLILTHGCLLKCFVQILLQNLCFQGCVGALLWQPGLSLCITGNKAPVNRLSHAICSCFRQLCALVSISFFLWGCPKKFGCLQEKSKLSSAAQGTDYPRVLGFTWCLCSLSNKKVQ